MAYLDQKPEVNLAKYRGSVFRNLSSCVVMNPFLPPSPISNSVFFFALGFSISYCRQVDHTVRYNGVNNLWLDIFLALLWWSRKITDNLSQQLGQTKQSKTKPKKKNILGDKPVQSKLIILPKGPGLLR